MVDLTKTNNSEIHNYSGSRDMATGRRIKIILSGGNLESETVLNERCPSGEDWTVKIAITKIIDNG